MYCVCRENVYNRLHFSVYTGKWGLLGRAELRVAGQRTPAFLSPSYYSERQKTLGGSCQQFLLNVIASLSP